MNDTPEKILAAFGFGKLQDLINLMESLESRGVAYADIKNYVSGYVVKKREELAEQQRIQNEQAEEELAEQQRIQNKQAEEDQQTYEQKAPKCPECGDVLMVRPIKGEGVQNVHGYQSQWYCINDEVDCVYEQYSMRALADELASVGIILREKTTPQTQTVTKTKKSTPAQNATASKKKPCHGCG